MHQLGPDPRWEGVRALEEKESLRASLSLTFHSLLEVAGQARCILALAQLPLIDGPGLAPARWGRGGQGRAAGEGWEHHGRD